MAETEEIEVQTGVEYGAPPESESDASVAGPSAQLASEVAWFEERGIPVPEDLAEELARSVTPLVESDEEDGGELEPEPEPEPQAVDPREAARQGFERRRENREIRELERRALEAEAYIDVLVESMQRRAGQYAPAAEAPAANAQPEAPPDFYENPEGAIAFAVKQATEPLLKRLARVEGVATEVRQSEASQKIVSSLESARVNYTRSNPTYEQDAASFRDAWIGDVLESGLAANPQEAVEMFKHEVLAISDRAMRAGKNPIAVLHRLMRRFVGAAPAQPAAPAAARSGDQRIAAAREAMEAGVVRVPEPSDGGAPAETGRAVTALRVSKMTPADVRELLRQPGGKAKFFELAKRAERLDRR